MADNVLSSLLKGLITNPTVNKIASTNPTQDTSNLLMNIITGGTNRIMGNVPDLQNKVMDSVYKPIAEASLWKEQQALQDSILATEKRRIMAEEGEKVLRNQVKTQAQEALQQPDGEKAILALLSQASIMENQKKETDGSIINNQSNNSILPREQSLQPTQYNILEKFINALPGGQARIADLEQTKLQNELYKQKLLGEEPLQKGEKEKIDLETDKAIKVAALNKLYDGKISDAEKKVQSQISFQNDLVNMVNAWDKLGSGKGVVGGRVGGLIAGTLGNIFGTGREARANFESVSNGLLYSVGDYVLGQSGRSLVEADLKRLEKMAKFTENMKAEDFKGKLKSIISFANSKIIASGGTPTINNVEELFSFARGKINKQQPSNSGIKSIKLLQ